MKGRRKIKFPHLLGSKWTSTRQIMGWRHFQVVAREDGKQIVFARLESVCATEVVVWVNAKTLNNRELWQPGWAPLATLSSEGALSEPP